MTYDDLKQQGVILPEEEWGRHELETTVHRAPLAAAFLIAVASWVLALLGDGGPLTWVGVVVFLVMLFVVTWLCDRAVLRQRRRFERERAAVGDDSSDTAGHP